MERIWSVSWQIPSPLCLHHPKLKMGIIPPGEELGLFKCLWRILSMKRAMYYYSSTSNRVGDGTVMWISVKCVPGQVLEACLGLASLYCSPSSTHQLGLGFCHEYSFSNFEAQTLHPG